MYYLHASILLGEIKKMKEHLKDVIDCSADTITVFNGNGKIKMFNKAALDIYGYSESEILNVSIEIFFENKKDAKAVIRKLFESPNNQIQNYEVSTKDKKGRIIPVNLSASLLFDEKGEKIGSVAVFRDLRIIKEMQDKVIQSERMAAMGIIARSVGHELKQDFSSIILYAEALLKFLTNNKMGYKTAQKIIHISDEGVEKLAKMLKALRPQPPKKKIWSVKELFDGMTDEFREKSRLKGITFNVKYTNNLPKIEVDSKQIKEVFYNLFNNSLDSTKEGEDINLSIQQKEDKLLICWENTGENIPEQDIPELFDPFFTRKAKGSGLGLSIIQMIIISHRGKIWIDPKKQKGARFYIELPISGDLA